uniref:Uncharacterized protein n=1 Tax=Anguilla anguilla TaxID=7936 RepID=A0A0E9WUL0_ANGAN
MSNSLYFKGRHITHNKDIYLPGMLNISVSMTLKNSFRSPC